MASTNQFSFTQAFAPIYHKEKNQSTQHLPSYARMSTQKLHETFHTGDVALHRPRGPNTQFDESYLTLGQNYFFSWH